MDDINLDNISMELFPNLFADNMADVETEVSNSAVVNEALVTNPEPKFYEDFEGEYGFELSVNIQHAGKNWEYSEMLNKLFVKMMHPVFIKVKCKLLGEGYFLRALPVFVGVENFNEPVVRCLHHKSIFASENKGYEDLLNHVIRSEHPKASYCHDNNSGRYSVVIPLEASQPGTQSICISYMFACKNSCQSGMNRRPTEIIFTLEDDKQIVLGKKCMQVRICSCPKRDRAKEEQNAFSHYVVKTAHLHEEKRSKSTAPSEPKMKKRKLNDTIESKHTMAYIPDFFSMGILSVNFELWWRHQSKIHIPTAQQMIRQLNFSLAEDGNYMFWKPVPYIMKNGNARLYVSRNDSIGVREIMPENRERETRAFGKGKQSASEIQRYNIWT